MKNKRLIVLYIFLIFSFLTVSTQNLQAEKKVLNVPNTRQEQTQWCWAGCSQAVLKYYKKTIKQCYMANFARSRRDCCTNPGNCNQPNAMYASAGSLQDILKRWCVGSKPVAKSLPWTTVKKEIKGSKPLIIRYGWATGGGHFIVLRGYESRNNNNFCYLMDPWNGLGTFTYDYVKQKAGHHTWTHTLRRIKLTKRSPRWNVKHSSLVVLGKSNWRYKIHLKDTRGGCGQVMKWYINHYDEKGNFCGRNDLTKNTFATWFDDCGDPDYQLCRNTEFCCTLYTTLGGRLLGSVEYVFEIKNDDGKKSVKKYRFGLPKSGSPLLIQENEDFTKPVTQVVRMKTFHNSEASEECVECRESNSKIMH